LFHNTILEVKCKKYPRKDKSHIMGVIDENMYMKAKFSTIVAGIATIAAIATVGVIGGTGEQQTASARPICTNFQLPAPVAGTVCVDARIGPVCPDGLVIIGERGEITITCP
jgi:hypothetical protein